MRRCRQARPRYQLTPFDPSRADGQIASARPNERACLFARRNGNLQEGGGERTLPLRGWMFA